MAKIVCEFDTETKQLAVMRDGVPMEGVSYACFSERWSEDGESPKWACSIEQYAKNGDKSSTMTITRAGRRVEDAVADFLRGVRP